MIQSDVFIPQVWQINNIQSYNKVNFMTSLKKNSNHWNNVIFIKYKNKYIQMGFFALENLSHVQHIIQSGMCLWVR